MKMEKVAVKPVREWVSLRTQGKKRCAVCRQVFDLERFHPRYGNRSGSHRSKCKRCENARQHERRKLNPLWAEIQREKSKRARARHLAKNPSYHREKRLRHEYGLTGADFEKMVEEQGGCCAICKNPPEYGKLVVDHNHDTGAVRQLLCNDCNTSLGFIERKGIGIIDLCAEYLERHKG
jgi:hypothetical protein